MAFGAVVLALAILAAPASAAGSGDWPPPASGDWWISNPTTASNETVQVNGTLYVYYGSLELDNVTLLINSTPSAEYGIYVYGAPSRLVVNNSVVKTYDPATRFYFYNFGALAIERSDISRLSTWGVLTYSANLVIRTNQIHDGSYGGVSAFFYSSQSTTTVVENNTIYAIDYFAIFVQYYSYFGAGAGPHSLSGDFIVRGNTVRDNIGGGIYAYRYFYDYLNQGSSLRANLTVENNDFLRNRGPALEVYNDIWNSQGGPSGNVSFVGLLNITGNRFEENSAYQAVYLRNVVTATFSGSCRVDLSLNFSGNRVVNNSGAGVYIDYLNAADHSSQADVSNDGSMLFANNVIQHNQGYGLRIYRYASASNARNASINGTVSILNNTITNNEDAGIYVWNYAYSTNAWSALIDGPVRIENNTAAYNSGYGIYTYNYAQKYQGDANGTSEIRGALTVRGNVVAYNLGYNAIEVTRNAVSYTGSTAYLGGDIDVSSNRVYNNSGNGISISFSANKNLGKASGLALIESNLTLEGNWVANNSLYIGVSIDRVATTYYSSASKVIGATKIRSNLIEGHDSNGLTLQQRTLNYFGSSGAESSQKGDVLFENNTIRRNNAAAAYLYYYSYSYYSTSSRVEANYSVLNNTITDNQAVGLWGYFFASADTALSGDTQLVSSVLVRGNDFSRNKGEGMLLYRQATSARTTGNDAAILGGVTFDRNTASGNLGEGLHLADYAANSQGDAGAMARILGPLVATNNVLTDNLGYFGGLVIDSDIYAYETETARRDAPLTVRNNTVRGNSGYGAWLSLTGYQYFFKSVNERGIFNDTSSILVENNHIDANSRSGLFVNFDLNSDRAVTTANPRVADNSFSGNLGANALYLRLIDLQGFASVLNNEISSNHVVGIVGVETGGEGTGLLFDNNSVRQNFASAYGVRSSFGAASYNLTVTNTVALSNDVAGPFFDLTNNGRTILERNTVRGAVNQTAAFRLMALASSAWITADNNTIDGNSGQGIYMVTEGLVTVEWNVASNNSRDGLAVLTGGDYLSSLARITMRNNTADGNGANGLWAYATNRLTIQDNRARNNLLAGIRINYLASAATVERNNLTSNRFGLVLAGNQTSSLTTSYPFVNLVVLNSLSAGLFVDDVAVSIWHSTITSPTGVDLSVRQGRIDAYETDVGYASGEVRGSGEIHVWWNLSFRVLWQSGIPVPQAVIQMNGSTGLSYGVKTANATGRVAPFLAEEWAMVDSTRLLWSPYTFTANKNGEEGSNTTELDRAKEVWIIITDRHPPLLVVDRPTDGAIYNRSYVSYSGNSSDQGSGFDRLEISIDGSLPFVAGVSPQGAFSGAFTLLDGNHTARFRALDIAGGETLISINFTVDTTPPILIILQPTGNLTNITLITVLVQTSPDAVSALIGYDVLTIRGNATFTAIVRLFEGPNLFRIRAVDRAGNSNETFLAITLDTTPPALRVTTPPENFLTKVQLQPVRGLSEPGARVWINGIEAEVDVAGAFETAVQLTDGNNTIAIDAQDKAGNWQYLRISGVLDRVPPRLVVTNPVEGLITRDDFVSVEGEAEPGAVVYVNGKGVVALGVFRESVFLTEGVNNITVIARDGAGNEARVSRTVVKDTTVPFLDIIDPAGGHGFTNVPSYTIRGLTEPSARVTAGAFFTTADPTGAFSLVVNLSQPETIFRIEAVDLIGNRNATAVTITLDTTPPDLIVYSPRDGSRYQVGSAEINGATEFGVLLTVNGASVQVASDGVFRWVVELSQGANNITVRATDQAGNVAEVSLTLYLGGGAPTEHPSNPTGTSQGLTAPQSGGAEAFLLLLFLIVGAAIAGLVRWRMKRPEQD